MPDAVPAATVAVLNDPFAELKGPLAGTIRMQLEVAESSLITPHMQRLVLTAPELAEFTYRPGQDVMLLVTVDGDRPLRRRYTIRAADQARRQITLDIVRHGDGPGERWVSSAQPGDRIEGIGPRGKVFPADRADWHLFVADESALAAVFAMAASLPAGTPAIVLLEVPAAGDEQDLASAADVSIRWLHRDGAPAGDPGALAAAVTDTELPPGHGHAYLLGEARVVLRLREVLAGRGLAADQISPKAYWGRGKANALHGEPAKD